MKHENLSTEKHDPGIFKVLAACTRSITFTIYVLTFLGTVYAPLSPEYPSCHPFHRLPTQYSERIVLRSSPAHLFVSILRPCCSLDRGRRQCRFWRQGLPGQGREVHEPGLQVRTEITPLPSTVLSNSRRQWSVSRPIFVGNI